MYYDEEYVNNVMKDIHAMMLNAKENGKLLINIQVIGETNAEYIKLFLQDLDITIWSVIVTGNQFIFTIFVK